MENIGKGIGAGIVALCIISVLLFWGVWSLIDWLFVDKSVKSNRPIQPQIELVIKDNKVDTVYIYRQP